MTPERKTELLNMIRSAGFVRVDVVFTGGGDEGSYESMLATTAEGTEMDIADDYRNGSSHPELASALEHETNQHWDWNGGGVYGTMTYDAENDTITLDQSIEEYVAQEREVW